MPINILMPALSPTMEEGNLAKWLVKEGDTVSSGDILAEIETDKATMEVEAVDEGIVGKILVSDGATGVKVNEVIAVLLEEGEEAGAIEATAPAPIQEAAISDTPSAPTVPSAQGVPVQSAVPAALNGQARIFASPLAKRLARDNGLDLGKVTGSGPRGRIVKRDIEEAMSAGSAKAAPAPEAVGIPETVAAPTSVAPATGLGDDQIRALYDPASYDEKPHDGMRKIIAKRLTESKQTVPHFYLTLDCELDALLALRSQINKSAPVDADGKPAFKISVNDFVIKAMALALRAVPAANATWTETGRLMHKHSDVGVAVAVPDGLFTPIIRQAETKTLSVIANEMKDLAKRAREKKLAPQEYQGGTTAISNLGMYGIKDFSAVINPPHGTILAVGAGQKRAVVKGDEIVAATIMSVTLSCDHRVVDGALGAELLGAFQSLIENPLGMLV